MPLRHGRGMSRTRLGWALAAGLSQDDAEMAALAAAGSRGSAGELPASLPRMPRPIKLF